MPKKSKKEKILADLRRRVRTEQSLEAPPTFRFQVKKEAVAPAHTQKPQQSSELTAIKRDLYKTCILATLAIAAEVIIYWFKR